MEREPRPGGDPAVRTEVPLGKPTAARMYDEALGGKDHYAVDRAANSRLYEAIGERRVRDTAMENRRFLGRAVEYLARECGVRQFLDVGSGLPTVRNTHQIAKEADPHARVVYVDIDPIVAVHGRALLADDNTRIVTADMRRPETILDDPELNGLLDFDEPVAVLFVAVFHFITEEDDPARIVGEFRKRQAPGSYVAISHLCADGMSEPERQGWYAGFSGATVPLVLRTEPEIERLFDGYELVEPGLVRPWRWRPSDDLSPRTDSLLGGVGRLD
ncbi:SAM-dependent methyltransferase [Actinomadura gamaensis]|uniref:SAM-dependent methyltransferase n=1 Tax=Actinomadura gamaensis TaxID=1763541 RepID=A0ABV9UDH0_9ACTN